jgi:putative transposase
MPNYRRAFVPGGCWFFTVNLLERRQVEYCYINPLKHQLVTRVCNWPYSSFHRDVRAGLFPQDWGGDIEIPGDFGERR